MSNEEKFLTLHPQGKKGVNILKRRYDFIKDYILKTVKKHGEIEYQELSDMAIRDEAGFKSVAEAAVAALEGKAKASA